MNEPDKRVRYIGRYGSYRVRVWAFSSFIDLNRFFIFFKKPLKIKNTLSFSPQTLRVVESVPVRIFFSNNNATYYSYFFFFFLILFNNSPRCKSESNGNSFMNLKMGFFIFEILSYDISDDFLHYPLRTWLSLVVDFFIIKVMVN